MRSASNRRVRAFAAALAIGTAGWAALGVRAQTPAPGRGQPLPPRDTLGLAHGTLDFDTPDFKLKLVTDSQTVAALQPHGAKPSDDTTPFDFTPSDQLPARQGDQFNHLGDITIRLRQDGWQDGAWVDLSSSNARKPVNAIAAAKTIPGSTLLASADLTATISGLKATVDAGAEPGGRVGGQIGGLVTITPITDAPVQVTRSWLVNPSGHLVLDFDVRNVSAAPVIVGGLGFPVVFNNMIQNFVTNRARTLPQAHETCSFFDPYLGLDAGYLQVTRLSGAGPALIVAPERGTHTPFEAFRPIADASRRGQTFEGIFEWTTHSLAYAENEWKSAVPWNRPTSVTLAPGESRRYGLEFLLSPEIPAIEKTLAANDRPVAVGIPGYIVPMDLDAKLFLATGKRKVARIESDPAGALAVIAAAPSKSGQLQYVVQGKKWGRARLSITFDDGTVQTIHYDVTKPAQQAIADMGQFLTTKAWFTDESDPFHRAPSVMSYDRANNRIVLQDTRAWIAGLSDEGGAGAWLAAMMKEFGQPKK